MTMLLNIQQELKNTHNLCPSKASCGNCLRVKKKKKEKASCTMIFIASIFTVGRKNTGNNLNTQQWDNS